MHKCTRSLFVYARVRCGVCVYVRGSYRVVRVVCVARLPLHPHYRQVLPTVLIDQVEVIGALAVGTRQPLLPA